MQGGFARGDGAMNKDNIFFKCKTSEDFVNVLKKAFGKNYYGYFNQERKTDSVEGRVYCINISTGGWSENEDVINDLKETIFWMLRWHQSTRGGHYEFRCPLRTWKEAIV